MVVNKPAYLPSSGTVVGEHSAWASGKGKTAYAGGAIPMGGVPDAPGGEVIIPSNQRGIEFATKVYGIPVAEKINAAMMARLGMTGPEQMGGQPVIVQDNTQAVQQHQHIHIPAPDGQTLPGERGNFVHKVA